MYITVVCDRDDRLAAEGPYEQAEPPGRIDARTCVVPLCPAPPAATDVALGMIGYIVRVPLAVATATVDPRPPRSPAELNAPNVALLVYPAHRLLAAVGPFTGPDRAEAWARARIDKITQRSVTYHVVPLDPPPPTRLGVDDDTRRIKAGDPSVFAPSSRHTAAPEQDHADPGTGVEQDPPPT